MGTPIRTINLGAIGQAAQAPLPKPDGALYRQPNPDETRKACRNCVMWVPSTERCIIHRKDQDVDGDQWCGFHVFGEPRKEWVEYEGIVPMTPEFSGLRMVGPGAACASCKFYRYQDEKHGICIGVSDPKTRHPGVAVQSRGICARYEGM